LGAGGDDTLCNKTKQPALESEGRKRIRDPHAQGKNNQSALGFVPSLNRVIPGVERLKERTNKAEQQNNHSRYLRRQGPHGFEYSAAADQGGKQNLRTPGADSATAV